MYRLFEDIISQPTADYERHIRAPKIDFEFFKIGFITEISLMLYFATK